MPSRKPAKKASASHARRIKNGSLAHGMTFSYNDRQYVLQEHDCEGGGFAYFQIWDITDKTSPEIVGNISRAVSCARI